MTKGLQAEPHKNLREDSSASRKESSTQTHPFFFIVFASSYISFAPPDRRRFSTPPSTPPVLTEGLRAEMAVLRRSVRGISEAQRAAGPRRDSISDRQRILIREEKRKRRRLLKSHAEEEGWTLLEAARMSC